MSSTKLLLTMWMNVPSHHQADMFRALVATDELDLNVIFVRRLGNDRTALGWNNDTQGYPNLILYQRNIIRQAFQLAWSQRHRIHIVNGLWAEPAISTAVMALRLSGSLYLNYAEVPDPFIHRSTAKLLIKHVFARAVTQKRTGLLAISHFSRDYHVALGFSPQFAYDYGYFVSGSHMLAKHFPDKPVKLLYIGQFIPRKGVDLLLAAFADLQTSYQHVTLTLVGDGPDHRQYNDAVRSFMDRVHFTGVLPSAQIRNYISEFHALVLPSRHDGWGVVINEALSVGVPVIVSDACGAADLIRDGENGYIFASNNVESLRYCIDRFLSQSELERQAMRDAARETGEQISAEAVTPYFVQCIRHLIGQMSEKPFAPWKS